MTVMNARMHVKNDFVKEQLRKVLKANNLCCCGQSFTCNNCRLVEQLREKTDDCCPNCYFKVGSL